jgi:hypothetical protein
MREWEHGRSGEGALEQLWTERVLTLDVGPWTLNFEY